MASREIVLKPVTDKNVAEKIDDALKTTKEKEEALRLAIANLKKEGFILK